MAEFDYIVVGAGSAGCVLANRLSASGGHQVLVLEAGGSDLRPSLLLPIGYGLSFYDPAVNWMFRTEPQPSLAGRPGYWPRGKVLGGSSAINAMVWIRGHPGDFDGWAAAGNPGWSWSDVLPYFKRMETAPVGADEWRGRSGPVHVSDVSADVHPLCESYLRAGAEVGFKRNPDFNGAEQEGVGLYQITTHRGVRMSAARAYLWPARRRPNLRIETRAQATKVLLDGRRAVGVAYMQGGALRTARARKEVILAAGAVSTPLLLQLSGIGPGDVLGPLGIPVLIESPAVGRHLQDHICVDHLYRSRVPTLNQELGPLAGKAKAALRYLLQRRGPLSLSVNQGGGFVRTRADLDRPNMQLYFSPVSYTRAPPGKRPLMSPDPFAGFLLGAQPCRPTSRGRLQLRANDPTAAPLIEPNALATDHDVQEMIEGARLLRRLAAAPALAAAIVEEIEPGAAAVRDSDLLDHARRRGSTVFHPVSTCRMGPDPALAAVDHRLMLHGAERLRVVDASIFPAVTSGNTNAPTIMVAEKGADMILAGDP
ncbi:MAG: GMC family oxidoreductase N-terminal domain-containing protein [Alphaproteobacteria bacterium]|nr:GMC family oxidoreductase N-terminal domain-containing protein [Alphaproteobacteria bacterium]